MLFAQYKSRHLLPDKLVNAKVSIATYIQHWGPSVLTTVDIETSR